MCSDYYLYRCISGGRKKLMQIIIAVGATAHAYMGISVVQCHYKFQMNYPVAAF